MIEITIPYDSAPDAQTLLDWLNNNDVQLHNYYHFVDNGGLAPLFRMKYIFSDDTTAILFRLKFGV